MVVLVCMWRVLGGGEVRVEVSSLENAVEA